jgi:hypothetical protein
MFAFYIFKIPHYVRLIFWIILLTPLETISHRSCERLTDIIGVGSWCDTFTVKNTTWLSLQRKIITMMNSDSVLCGAFGLYPSCVAGIANAVEETSFMFSVMTILYALNIQNKLFRMKNVHFLVFRVINIISCLRLTEKLLC